MTSFALEPIYGSLLLALVAATVSLAVILVVTPPTPNRSQRRVLIGLRLLAASVLLLVVFRPTLLQTDKRPVDAALVVAADTSRSMTLPDGDGGDRWTTQVQVWRTLADGIRGLDESLSIRLLTYDVTAKSLSAAGVDALDNKKPDGELTDLAAAALATIQAAAGQPIAGVVLIGDGTQTAPLRGTGAQRVAETLNSLGVPLWTVPIGPAGGASALRDAAVDALPESLQLFAGNEIDIEFQVLLRGLSAIEVPVRISWIDSEDQVTEVAVRTVTAAKSNDTAALTVGLTAPPPGTYRLKVEAESQDGELVTTNNRQIAFVDVREGGGRILYLEGTPRPEQTFLRRSLRRFPDLDLTFRWIPNDTSAAWPVEMQDWFRPGKFDIYILGDLDAGAIGKSQLQQLTETVASGAGLITLGGFHSYGPGGYASSPLAEVIPVQMDPARRHQVHDESAAAGQLVGPVALRLARNHPIVDLGGEDPTELWQQLPPQLGANRLPGPKVAPGIEVLLDSPAGDSMLVIGQYGKGRSAALAFDSTWRWWRAGHSEAHRRFWRQLVLWLLAREQTGGDQIAIEIDARRFSIDDPPEFRARVDSIADAAKSIELVAEVVSDSGDVIPVSASTQTSSESSNQSSYAAIAGRLPKLEPGIYRLRVRPTADVQDLEPQQLAFQAIDESRELAQPMADPVYLRQLAELTAAHGGAAFEPEDIGALIDTIAERRRQGETPIIEKFRLGDGPTSGWLLFGLFTGALSTEWLLRRRWGLV